MIKTFNCSIVFIVAAACATVVTYNVFAYKLGYMFF
jgi:hypothetical protein